MLELHDIHFTIVLVKSEHWSVPQVSFMSIVAGEVGGLFNYHEIAVRLSFIPSSESVLVAMFHLIGLFMRPGERRFFLNNFLRHATVDEVLWVI